MNDRVPKDAPVPAPTLNMAFEITSVTNRLKFQLGMCMQQRRKKSEQEAIPGQRLHRVRVALLRRMLRPDAGENRRTHKKGDFSSLHRGSNVHELRE